MDNFSCFYTSHKAFPHKGLRMDTESSPDDLSFLLSLERINSLKSFSLFQSIIILWKLILLPDLHNPRAACTKWLCSSHILYFVSSLSLSLFSKVLNFNSEVSWQVKLKYFQHYFRGENRSIYLFFTCCLLIKHFVDHNQFLRSGEKCAIIYNEEGVSKE